MGAWETYKLGDLAKHVKERYPVSALTLDNYISTENVLPNRGGRVTANTLPQAGNVVAWRTDDVLVPNIRPYFKKIWRGQGVGGASADVMVIRVRDEQKILPRLLYYYLSSDAFFAHVMAGANGAKMPRGNRTYTMQFELSLPPLEEQERIAGVLGAYDDLIAVNERRMALLEEAAHRLFHDRFVTHADPDWSRRPLGEVIKFVRGRSYTSTELEEPTSDKGVLLINLKNLRPFGGYLRGEEKRFLGKWREDQCVEQGDILMGVTDMTTERRLVGHVARVPKLQERAVFSMDLVKLEPLACEKEFLFGFLSQPQCGKLFSAFANGATVSHLRPDTLVDEPVLNPPLAVQRNYGQQVQPLYEAIDVLAAQNALLRAGRDKLLPRLLREEA